MITVGDRAATSLDVVLLHGWGMVPEDLAPFARSMNAPAWFAFPEGVVLLDAPRGDGVVPRGWWQHVAGDQAAQEPRDLPTARDVIARYLDSIAAPNRRMILGGFSQGAMVAADLVVRGSRRCDGLVLLSSSRIAAESWKAPLSAGVVRGLPIFISHGRDDHDVRFAAGEALRDTLVAAGATVTWLPFDGGHIVPLRVWRELKKFVAEIDLVAP